MNFVFSAKSFFVVLFVFALLCQTLYAGPLRPLQIFLPGNFNGKAAFIDNNFTLGLSKQWLLPSLADTLKKPTEKDSLTIALGGNANLFSALSFLFSGEIENALINEFKPRVKMLNTAELELFAGGYVPRSMLSGVLTNYSSLSGGAVFKQCEVLQFSSCQTALFNFIEPRLLNALPLASWGLKAEEPVKSLRQIKTMLGGFNDKTLTLSTACLNKQECLKLANEFKKLSGTHIIVQLQAEGADCEFSTLFARQLDNVFIFSLPYNNAELPIIEVIFNNFRKPRIRLKSPSAAKYSLTADKYDLFKDRVKKRLTKPLRVVSAQYQATEAVFSIAPTAVAKMLKGFNGADAAIILKPCANCFADNVICVGHVLSAFKNDRVYSLCLNGAELAELLSAVIAQNAYSQLAFAGFNLKWAANRLVSLNINGKPCLDKQRYFINITETALNYLKSFGLELPSRPCCEGNSAPALFKAAKTLSKPCYEGNSLWKALLLQLSAARLSDKELIEE